MTQNDMKTHFSSAARAKTMHAQKLTLQQSSLPLAADSAGGGQLSLPSQYTTEYRQSILMDTV